MKLIGLKGRIPVEPLDDERLTNIERRIVMGASDAASAPSMRGRRSEYLRLAFAVAMVAIVAVGAGWYIRGGGGTTAPIVAAEPIRMNTTAERSTLDIGDATIDSDPLTDYTVTRPDGGVLVAMKRGKVELQVGKRGDRAPLVVAAGDTQVIVVGTRFSVDYGDGTGGVDVRVTEGVVRVERQQQEVRVAAGQAWTSKTGVVAIGVLPPRETAVAIAKTIDDQPGTDDNIEIHTDTPDVLRDRTAAVPETKIPTTPTVTAVKKTVGPELAVRPHSERGSGGGSSAAMDLFSLVRKEAVLPPLDLGLRPEESISKYKEVAFNVSGEKRAFGEEASVAHYSIAYMQAMKLGRTADALTTLDAYVRRYSGGKESHSWGSYKAALWLRVRILCSKTMDDRCRQAAYTYMHEASDTSAAHVAEAITLSPR